jgi:hypothetical protein
LNRLSLAGFNVKDLDALGIVVNTGRTEFSMGEVTGLNYRVLTQELSFARFQVKKTQMLD